MNMNSKNIYESVKLTKELAESYGQPVAMVFDMSSGSKNF